MSPAVLQHKTAHAVRQRILVTSSCMLRLGLRYVILVLLPLLAVVRDGAADSAQELRRKAGRALNQLYASTPAAKAIGNHSAGVLVFPEIYKGGFLVGAQYGEGVLFRRGAVAGYYRSTAGSFGLQAGAQKFGYALFFVSEKDLTYLDRSAGWELGLAPASRSLTKG